MSLLFNATATIYTEDAPSGRFSAVARSGLPCRLLHASYRPAATSADRAELAAERIFLWPAAEYTLPAFCQIEVDGARWAPVDINAFERLNSPAGTIHHGRVPVRRQS